MCTVSYIPTQSGCFITSNRDEHISRPSAQQPKEETLGSVKVLFPKDPKAGGTWFALNEHGAVSVLLNGGFVGHRSVGGYRRSRGLVLLDVISSHDPHSKLWEMDLHQIEPFTLILFSSGLLEFRWDGNQKYFRPMDVTKHHIWSSATLYNDEVIGQRADLFEQFVSRKGTMGASDVVDFHSNNNDDYENGFIIDRESGLKTFSVTQVVLGGEDAELHHFDLLNDMEYRVPFLSKPITML